MHDSIKKGKKVRDISLAFFFVLFEHSFFSVIFFVWFSFWFSFWFPFWFSIFEKKKTILLKIVHKDRQWILDSTKHDRLQNRAILCRRHATNP